MNTKKGRSWNKSSLCTELKICGLQIENPSWIVYYNFAYSIVICSCVKCCECTVTIQFILVCILKTTLITSTRTHSSSRKNYLVVSDLWLILHYCIMLTVKTPPGTTCCIRLCTSQDCEISQPSPDLLAAGSQFVAMGSHCSVQQVTKDCSRN